MSLARDGAGSGSSVRERAATERDGPFEDVSGDLLTLTSHGDR